MRRHASLKHESRMVDGCGLCCKLVVNTAGNDLAGMWAGDANVPSALPETEFHLRTRVQILPMPTEHTEIALLLQTCIAASTCLFDETSAAHRKCTWNPVTS